MLELCLYVEARAQTLTHPHLYVTELCLYFWVRAFANLRIYLVMSQKYFFMSKHVRIHVYVQAYAYTHPRIYQNYAFMFEQVRTHAVIGWTMPLCSSIHTHTCSRLHVTMLQNNLAAQQVVTAARVLRMFHLIKILLKIYTKISEDLKKRRNMQAMMSGTSAKAHWFHGRLGWKLSCKESWKVGKWLRSHCQECIVCIGCIGWWMHVQALMRGSLRKLLVLMKGWEYRHHYDEEKYHWLMWRNMQPLYTLAKANWFNKRLRNVELCKKSRIRHIKIPMSWTLAKTHCSDKGYYYGASMFARTLTYTRTIMCTCC